VPFYRFEIETPLSPQVAAQRIREMTSEPPAGMVTFGRPDRRARTPFLGRVDDRAFQIRRVIGYRNSFLPRIRGRIEPATVGSTVRITMAVHPVVILFLVVWLAIIGRFAYTETIAPLLAGQPPGWFAAVMLLLMLTLTVGSFWYEASQARKLLQDALRA
jgi:hypothetical protein